MTIEGKIEELGSELPINHQQMNVVEKSAYLQGKYCGAYKMANWLLNRKDNGSIETIVEDMNHEIPTICPNCGHEYYAHLHWLVCPRCGQATERSSQTTVEAKGTCGTYTHKVFAVGKTIRYNRSKYHIVLTFADKDDFFYVVKRYSNHYHGWLYEVWSAFQIDLYSKRI